MKSRPAVRKTLYTNTDTLHRQTLVLGLFFFFFTVQVFTCCLVSKSCLLLWDPMDCSPPGSSVHGIFQARILEWVAKWWQILRWVWNDWKGSRSSGASQPAAGGRHGQKSLRTGGLQEGVEKGRMLRYLWPHRWGLGVGSGHLRGVPAGGFEDWKRRERGTG